MQIHSQPSSDSVSTKLRNINHALLDGMECCDKLGMAYTIIEYKDSLINKYRKNYTAVSLDNIKLEKEVEKYKANNFNLWDKIKYVSVGFVAGLLTYLAIVVFQ